MVVVYFGWLYNSSFSSGLNSVKTLAWLFVYLGCRFNLPSEFITLIDPLHSLHYKILSY